MIVTFYSYKGGVGRSFCLANVAVQLARWGNRVLCVDWDLEAPGLHEYFRQWTDEPSAGVVELVTADGPVDWRSAVLPVRIDGVDGLHLLASGRMDDGYVDRVQAISWPELYAEHDLGWRFEQLADELRAEYDFVLIDSRTGITDIGGICTAQLPDVLVLCLTPNRQNLAGAAEVARRAVAARNDLPYDKSGLLVLPVVSRFDGREEYERAQQWRRVITDSCAHLYDNWVPEQVDRVNMIERTTVPYLPYWSFGEELPAITENSANPEMVTHYLDNIAALLRNGLTDADVLVANRDSYVAAARIRPARADGEPADLAVFGPAHQADPIRDALEAFGVRVDRAATPASLRGPVSRAIVLSDGGRQVSAPLGFEASLWWTPGHDPVSDAAAMIRVVSPTTPTLRAALVRVADRYVSEGNLSAAEDTLAPISWVDPSVRTVRARLATEQGDFAEAIGELGTLPDPDFEQSRLLGRAYVGTFDFAMAQHAFTQALGHATGDDRVDVRRDLAAAYLVDGDHERAETTLRAAVEAAEHGSPAWLGAAVDLAVLQRRLGRLADAEEILRAASTAHGPPEVRLMVGQHLASILEQRGDPIAVQVWAGTAHLARSAGDIETMTDAVRSVIRVAGEERQPLADMVFLVSDARKDARDGKQVAELRELSGVLRIALRDYNEANHELEQALIGYRRLKDPAGVARTLAHLASIDETFGELDRARRRLAEVRSLLPGLRGAQADVVRDLISGSSAG